MRRDGSQAGVAGASAARWLIRILIATVVVVVGLALAATSAQADVTAPPLGTSAGKLTQTGRSAAGTTTTQAKAKAAVRSAVPKVKIRARAKAAPVRRVARKAAPVRSYRAARATRTVVRKAAPVRSYRAARATRTVVRKAAPVRSRIATGQRKTSPGPTAKPVRKATAPKAQPAHRAKTSTTKINRGSSKIKSVVDRIPVAGLPVPGVRVPTVVTPEIKVTVGDSVEVSAPPVGLQFPLLSLVKATLPPEPPAVTIPRTDLPALALPRTGRPTSGWPVGTGVAAEPIPLADQRAGPVDGAASARRAQVATAQRPVTAYAAVLLSLDVGMMRAIGPPGSLILDELGQRIRPIEVPASVAPTTVLIIAAAIAAATGTATSGSAGGGGLTVLSAIFGLPALGGSRRLIGRRRESAFGTPRRPGFSPD